MSETQSVGGLGKAPPLRPVEAPSQIAWGTEPDELAILPNVDHFGGTVQSPETKPLPPPASQLKTRPPSADGTMPFSIYTANQSDPKLIPLTMFQRIEGYELAALMLMTINNYANTNDANSKETAKKELLDQWLTAQALQGAGQNPGLVGFLDRLGINAHTVNDPSNLGSKDISSTIASLLKQSSDLRAELKIKPLVTEAKSPSGA